jgi:predicted TIM-barrel fold metal-dependent hydrolase
VAGGDIVEFEPFLREMCLLYTGRVWVKLSGTDRLSRAGAPFDDTRAILRGLADHAPERVR